eukprot:scaffold36377_cov66-Phaeocystis_antarctica.AAC.5
MQRGLASVRWSGRALASVRWSGRGDGKRGVGSRRWRCVLPDESCGGRVALGLGPLLGDVATLVEQLGVGLGSQQGLHARLVPSASGQHQGGGATVGLQVGVGRVLQEEEQGGEVATGRSIHERSVVYKAGWQVDARASLQQLPHQLQLEQSRAHQPALPRAATLPPAASPASGGADEAAASEAAVGGGGAASCCRMSSTMAVWLVNSAHCRAVLPRLPSSSVLALARSRAFTHAS